MKLEDFNYVLPKELIAQQPAEPRDSCRLLMVDKKTGEWQHRRFRDILDEIRPGDVFVFNNTKVIPARLFGRRKGTGGKVEALLLTPKGNDVWEILVNPGRKALPGQEIEFSENFSCTVIDKTEFGGRLVKFHYSGDFDNWLDQLGEKLYLLLLSEERPDLTALCAQFGTGAPPETRPYDPLLERVTAGSCWQFRLTANPTRSKKDSADHTARGTLKPCYLEVEQEEWLWAQAAKHGFAVSEGSFAVTRKQTYHFKKNGTRPVTLLAVTYEGILQVTDPEAFKALLCEGVGRGKAYGLGLMTIIHRGGDHG